MQNDTQSGQLKMLYAIALSIFSVRLSKLGLVSQNRVLLTAGRSSPSMLGEVMEMVGGGAQRQGCDRTLLDKDKALVP